MRWLVGWEYSVRPQCVVGPAVKGRLIRWLGATRVGRVDVMESVKGPSLTKTLATK
jgi:hypothetical protein